MLLNLAWMEFREQERQVTNLKMSERRFKEIITEGVQFIGPGSVFSGVCGL